MVRAGGQLEGGGGEASLALQTLVRVCALFENSMFLLDYKSEYLFGEFNEKNINIVIFKKSRTLFSTLRYDLRWGVK